MEYDCLTGTRKILSLTNFAENDFQGGVIYHAGNWKDIPPIPDNSGVLKIVCSK
jgi:hypothetical protein